MTAYGQIVLGSRLMLNHVHHALTPDVLTTLMTMGHGDQLAIVDANFPAASVAASTGSNLLIEWPIDTLLALEAVLRHFPLDTYDADVPAVQGMAVVDEPGVVPQVVAEAAPLFTAAGGFQAALVERHAFYRLTEQCFAVIRTAERRPYGNFVLRKGVVSH